MKDTSSLAMAQRNVHYPSTVTTYRTVVFLGPVHKVDNTSRAQTGSSEGQLRSTRHCDQRLGHVRGISQEQIR
jgi:hypothetical protein